MAEQRLIIKKRGEDSFKNFSIRIKESTVQKLDDLSVRTNISRNELINIILDFGIEHCDII